MTAHVELNWLIGRAGIWNCSLPCNELPVSCDSVVTSRPATMHVEDKIDIVVKIFLDPCRPCVGFAFHLGNASRVNINKVVAKYAVVYIGSRLNSLVSL